MSNVDTFYQIQKIVNCEKALAQTTLEKMSSELLKEAKNLGFSDEQIAKIMKDGSTDEEIYEKRKALGISRVYKMVDTCSAEFEAKTPYFYSTFEWWATFKYIVMIIIDEKELPLSSEQENDLKLEIAIMLYEKANYSFYLAAN